MSAKIEMVGNWRKEMNLSLGRALHYTYEIGGRSLAEACKHAIILMAQSARAMTKQSPKNRKVRSDRYGRYVEDYRKSETRGGQPRRLYEWFWSKDARSEEFIESARVVARTPTFADAIPIANRGLGKKSWMWGLAKLGKGSVAVSKPIRGVIHLRKILTDSVGGFILYNRLDYVLKAMPAGWQAAVEQKASNKIMKQAQMKLEREWARTVNTGRPGRIGGGVDLGKYFAKVA